MNLNICNGFIVVVGGITILCLGHLDGESGGEWEEETLVHGCELVFSLGLIKT